MSLQEELSMSNPVYVKVIVEGQTEEAFVNRVLVPYFADKTNLHATYSFV